MMKLLINLGVLSLILLPAIASAQGVVRMTGLPFEPNGNNADIEVYIRALYRLAIGVAAMLAVLRLIMAGAQYILSDVVTKKEDAKQNIRTSIVGLLIVLSAVLILTTINPSLTNFNVLQLNQLNDPPPSPEQCDVNESATCCDGSGGQWIINSGVGTCNTGGESPNELEDDIAEETIEDAIDEGEFSEVIEIYDLESIPLSERSNYVQNIWPEQCEVNSDGEETGYRFTEIENVQAGVIRYVCVQ